MEIVEPKDGVERKKDQLSEIERELEAIKQVLLREIVTRTQAGAEMDEALLKKIAGYLKVVQGLAGVIRMRSKEPREVEGVMALRLVWEVLEGIPKIQRLLSDPAIKSQILKAVQERMKEKARSQS